MDRLEARVEEEKTRAESLVGEAMLDAHKATQASQSRGGGRRGSAQGRGACAARGGQAGGATARGQGARDRASEEVAEAVSESKRLAVEAEQDKLLATDVQRRSIGSRSAPSKHSEMEPTTRAPATKSHPSAPPTAGRRSRSPRRPRSERADVAELARVRPPSTALTLGKYVPEEARPGRPHDPGAHDRRTRHRRGSRRGDPSPQPEPRPGLQPTGGLPGVPRLQARRAHPNGGSRTASFARR